VRASQDSMQFAVLDQNAGSLRGGRIPSSGEADGELLHLVEHGVRDVLGHGNPCFQKRPRARRSYGCCGQSNNQVAWIIGNPDVHSFYSSLLKFEGKLSGEVAAELRALVNKGEPEKDKDDGSPL
jgi:hypothetical protein